jgi:Stage II sporulation protein E (SpoIIE)
MPVEGAIPQLAGIEMYGNSIPAGTVGGDLFEYINFQQRYNIDGRIARALKLAKLYLDPLPAGQPARNMVDDHVCPLETRLNNEPSTPLKYRKSEKLRAVAYRGRSSRVEDHGRRAAGGCSTARSYLGQNCIDRPRYIHALMLVGLDRYGKTTPGFLEQTAAGAIGHRATRSDAIPKDSAREIATMLYGEMRPEGLFRFVNFGHPPPLVFSNEFAKFMEIGQARMVPFPPLGLEIPEDRPEQIFLY